MLVIDDSKLKLLKMKEKLLEVSKGDRVALLDDYKKLAMSIDKDIYNAVVKMIQTTDARNLPLSEQLTFLMQVEEEYNSFDELLCTHKNVCARYGDTFELPFENDILIDNIRARISLLSGYLTSVNNIANNNIEIENLNIDLVNEEKKKDSISNKLEMFETELKDNFLNAEGRILLSDGNVKYTSTVTEYEEAGLDLNKLLTDKTYLEEELKMAIDANSSAKEKMQASRICYQSIGDDNTRELYNASYKEYNDSEYKLLLLRIVELITTTYNEYSDVKNKRDTLIQMIKNRYLYLNRRFLADPFTRIKIDSQLEIIERFKDNADEITSIKNRINSLVSHNEELESKKNELALHLNDDFSLLDMKVPLKGTDISEVYDKYKKNNSANQVIDIKDPESDFNMPRVMEKVRGVISRVNEMLRQSVSVDAPTATTPDLVIEESPFEEEPVADIFEDASEKFTEEKTDDIFPDLSQLSSDDEAPAPQKVDADLFEDVKPFEDTQLFTDKIDDEMPEEPKMIMSFDDKTKDKDIDEMPDAFWVTQSEETDEEESKVRKLTA